MKNFTAKPACMRATPHEKPGHSRANHSLTAYASSVEPSAPLHVKRRTPTRFPRPEQVSASSIYSTPVPLFTCNNSEEQLRTCRLLLSPVYFVMYYSTGRQKPQQDTAAQKHKQAIFTKSICLSSVVVSPRVATAAIEAAARAPPANTCVAPFHAELCDRRLAQGR